MKKRGIFNAFFNSKKKKKKKKKKGWGAKFIREIILNNK